MLLASVLLFALFLGSPGTSAKAVPATARVPQVRPVPDEALRLNQRLAPKLSPSARSKVQSAATAGPSWQLRSRSPRRRQHSCRAKRARQS